METIGQILKIPSTTGTVTYVVKSGDNLYSIANKYNTTVFKNSKVHFNFFHQNNQVWFKNQNIYQYQKSLENISSLKINSKLFDVAFIINLVIFRKLSFC